MHAALRFYLSRCFLSYVLADLRIARCASGLLVSTVGKGWLKGGGEKEAKERREGSPSRKGRRDLTSGRWEIIRVLVAICLSGLT